MYIEVMPGQRTPDERTKVLQVRVTPAEADAWQRHVARGGGYISVLIRRAVKEYIARHRGERKPPKLYD